LVGFGGWALATGVRFVGGRRRPCYASVVVDERNESRVREERGKKIAVVIVVLTGLAFAAWWGIAGSS
jgi:hypothetical protein